MTVLPIITGASTPILKKKTVRVKKMTKELLQLIEDMQETMMDAKGAGIAAPQMNRNERICIAKIGEEFVPLVNPEITWKGKREDTMEEGCLSLPNLWIDITRPTEIVLEFETPKGKHRELKLSGFDARVVQHEVDHLDGILIVDRVNSLPRPLS